MGQRIRVNIEKGKASFKPDKAAAAVEIPHVPKLKVLKEDCENFLYEFKNFLRELLDVFNQLYGTAYVEVSEWLWGAHKRPQSVIAYATATFGEGDIKTRFVRQMKGCNGPFISMRNAVEHPGERSGVLTITDFTIGANGNLIEPCGREQQAERWNRGRSRSVRTLRMASTIYLFPVKTYWRCGPWIA